MSIQFQTLSNEFNILINKYQDTYKKYIDTINSHNKDFKVIDNSSFYGEKQITSLNNIDISNCQSNCLSNTLCSGATFNTTNNNCTLSSGSGNILPAHNSKSIIKQSIYYGYELQNLNNKLVDINKKMIDAYNNNYQKYKDNKSMAQQKEIIMNNNYNILTEERKQIDNIINEAETINRAYENGNVTVSSNYYRYIVLLAIVIILITLFLNFSFTSKQIGGSNILNKISMYKVFLYFFILIVVINLIYYGYNS